MIQSPKMFWNIQNSEHHAPLKQPHFFLASCYVILGKKTAFQDLEDMGQLEHIPMYSKPPFGN